MLARCVFVFVCLLVRFFPNFTEESISHPGSFETTKRRDKQHQKKGSHFIFVIVKLATVLFISETKRAKNYQVRSFKFVFRPKFNGEQRFALSHFFCLSSVGVKVF